MIVDKNTPGISESLKKIIDRTDQDEMFFKKKIEKLADLYGAVTLGIIDFHHWWSQHYDEHKLMHHIRLAKQLHEMCTASIAQSKSGDSLASMSDAYIKSRDFENDKTIVNWADIYRVCFPVGGQSAESKFVGQLREIVSNLLWYAFIEEVIKFSGVIALSGMAHYICQMPALTFSIIGVYILSKMFSVFQAGMNEALQEHFKNKSKPYSSDDILSDSLLLPRVQAGEDRDRDLDKNPTNSPGSDQRG